MAAKAAAKAGQHEVAVDLLKPVLQQLYDSFLDKDTRKTKLDGQGRLVLVPNAAPADRLQRYLDVNDNSICLDQPQMYHHGTSPARAAIEVLQTMDLIDWSSANVTWPLPECPLESCKERISNYVRKTAEWVKTAFEAQRPYPATGDDKEKDKYPGPENTTWYTWKNQDVTGCNDERAPYVDESGIRSSEFVDRPQTIQAAKEQLPFIHEYMVWAASSVPDGAEVTFTEADLRRLLVTFLNRVVHDSTAASQGDLFACDVEGNLCPGDDIEPKRSRAAVNWLILAYAAKVHGAMAKSRQAACDTYRMVETVLPLASGPWTNKFDEGSFGKLSESWAADAILAKYYFYNYNYGISKYCDSAR